MTTGSIGGGAAAVPGANKQVIFNDAGVLAGDSGLTYDKTTDALTVAGTGATVGLDLSTSDKYADLRVIRNSRNSVDHAMFLGYNPTPAGSPCAVYIYNDNTWRAGFDAAGVTLPGLAGTGSRVVEASSAGVLSATNRKDRDLIYDSGLTASVAEIIVQGIFTSAYRDYEIEAGELAASAAANIHMRQYSGASPVSGNVHYGHVCAGYNTTAVIQTGVYSPATQWHLWLASGTIIVNGRASIRVSGPAIATGTTIYGTMGASFSAGGAWGLFGGTHQAATAYDGFGIFPGSGTIVGRVKVYGVR